MKCGACSAGAADAAVIEEDWRPTWMTSAGPVVNIDGSRIPWVSDEPQGQGTWGRPGAWPYACLGPSSRWALPAHARAHLAARPGPDCLGDWPGTTLATTSATHRSGSVDPGMWSTRKRLPDQRRQTCCTCSLLATMGHRSTDGNNVEAFDARYTVGGILLLKPIHLMPVQLCRPS